MRARRSHRAPGPEAGRGAAPCGPCAPRAQPRVATGAGTAAAIPPGAPAPGGCGACLPVLPAPGGASVAPEGGGRAPGAHPRRGFGAGANAGDMPAGATDAAPDGAGGAAGLQGRRGAVAGAGGATGAADTPGTQPAGRPKPAAPRRRGDGAASGSRRQRPRGASIRIAFRSDPETVHRAVVRLRRWIEAAGAPAGPAADAELVLAEVLNNVAEHAYPDRPGPVAVALHMVGGFLICRVRDRGRPLPDGALPGAALPPRDGPRADLPEGGFGWYLIRTLAFGVRYRRHGGESTLRLVLAGINPPETETL